MVFLSFFYYYHYYFRLVFFWLALYFIMWLYNDLLNFLFCKCILPHPTSICSKLVLLRGALLFTLSISLIKFLLVECPGTKHLTYLVIVDFTFKTCICACYLKKSKLLLFDADSQEIQVNFLHPFHFQTYKRYNQHIHEKLSFAKFLQPFYFVIAYAQICKKTN